MRGAVWIEKKGVFSFYSSVTLFALSIKTIQSYSSYTSMHKK